MTIDIFGDGIGYVTDEVSSINVEECNKSEENRSKWVTDLASISRGKYESNNPNVRYKQLMKEASPTMEDIKVQEKLNQAIVPENLIIDDWLIESTEEPNTWETITTTPFSNRPSRPLEFLPLVFTISFNENYVYLGHPDPNNQSRILSCTIDHFLKYIAKHSYISKGYLYTNMRTLINSNLRYEYIPYTESPLYRSFKAIRIKVPMFVFGQLMTHTMISKESQSDRVAESTEYWLPSDFIEKLIEYNINHPKIQANISNRNECYDILTADTINAILNLRLYAVALNNNETTRKEVHNNLVKELLRSYSQNVVQNIFKFLEYKREIWSRGMYYFKYKEMILTGWNNDPEVWEHLLLEREVYPELHKSWVQDETRKVCEAIAKVIKNKKL